MPGREMKEIPEDIGLLQHLEHLGECVILIESALPSLESCAWRRICLRSCRSLWASCKLYGALVGP